MAWDDIDWSKPDLPKNPPPVPEENRLEPPKRQMKEKRLWDGVDVSDRTRGKCKSCGISPENISVSTGNCYDCDDKQPQLFDRQLNPTQIHGRSVHASLFRQFDPETERAILAKLQEHFGQDDAPKFSSHGELTT